MLGWRNGRQSLREIGHVAVKRLAKTAKYGEGKIPITPLDAAHVGAVDPCPISKLLLGPAESLAAISQTLAKGDKGRRAHRA